MRTPLRIDDDVLFAAKERTGRESRSSGDVLSELARAALTHSEGPETPEAASSDGFDPLPHRGAVVSNELIDRLLEDEPE